MNLRTIPLKWQESAQNAGIGVAGLSLRNHTRQCFPMAGAKYSVPACVSLNRYPSPSPRLDLPKVGSGNLSNGWRCGAKRGETHRNSLNPAVFPLYRWHKRQKCGGSRRCNSGKWESVWSLRRSLPGVWTTILNVVQPAQPVARLSQARPAAVCWAAPSLAARRAFCATTSTSVTDPLKSARKSEEFTTVRISVRAVKPVGRTPFGPIRCGGSQDHLHGEETCSKKS